MAQSNAARSAPVWPPEMIFLITVTSDAEFGTSKAFGQFYLVATGARQSACNHSGKPAIQRSWRPGICEIEVFKRPDCAVQGYAQRGVDQYDLP